MANTYTQTHVHIVFAVKYRKQLVAEENREAIEKYITGIITNRNSKLLAIYCNPDHIHILTGIHPSISLSEFVRDIKIGSTKWINENNLSATRFSWQTGYSGFHCAKKDTGGIINYILNQKEHQLKISFEEELVTLLEENDVEYDEAFLFESEDV